MIEYIKGKLQERTPAYVIVEVQGVGYKIHISLTTFSNIPGEGEVKIFIHELIREDTHELYGFLDSFEREIFLHLISVSGVGANTARVMLSSLTATEVREAILLEQVNALKAVKGIGAKTAQRIIVDLKDKLGKLEADEKIAPVQNNTLRQEALSALVTLGFVKNKAEKVIDKVIASEPGASVETIIKEALKLI
ncbi:MAG: Holliday junction branch migration protein RuvA [Bacteroidales bacterium]